MLYDEDGLGLHTVNDDGDEDHDDDQIRDQPMQSDQNFSRNSYVYANEENDQYFQTGIYKRWYKFLLLMT